MKNLFGQTIRHVLFPSKAQPAFREDLFVSPHWIMLGQWFFLLIFYIVTTRIEDTNLQYSFRLFRVLMLSLLIMTWGISLWKMQASRWFYPLSLLILIEAGYRWLENPLVFGTAFIPVLVAYLLLGIRAAGLLAVSTGGVIAWHQAEVFAAHPEVIYLTWLNLASVTFLLILLNIPIRSLREWTWDYYQKACTLIAEARSQQASFRQAIEDMTHANRQLALLNERAVTLRAIAEEAEKAKVDFVAKVSHEFRTPLNMIIGLVGVMVETPQVYGRGLSTAVLKDLQVIHRNSEHLASLINDVLDLSQSQAGKLTLHKERVQFSEIVQGAVEVIKPLIERKGLELLINQPDVLPEIYCDRTRVRQVILNLLSNAARYTDRGRITLSVEEQPERILVSVADTGPGIPPEDQARIFEPFCQGSLKTWRDKGGSGLGLTICKQFIELHGGRIWLRSDLGKGTILYFDLPIAGLIKPIVSPTGLHNPDWIWHERNRRPNRHYDLDRPRLIVCDESGAIESLIGRRETEAELVYVQSFSQAVAEATDCPAHSVLWNFKNLANLQSDFAEAYQRIPNTPIIGCFIPKPVNLAEQLAVNAYLVKPVQRARFVEVLDQLNQPVRRVLVAEDDEDSILLVSRLLNSYDPTLEVEVAPNGAVALQHLRQSPPDLLLLDLSMPEIDGFQLIAAKQQDPALASIPVIVISGQDLYAQPQNSQGIFITIDQGITLEKVFEFSLAAANILLTAHEKT